MKGFENPGASPRGLCPHGKDPESCVFCTKATVVESDHHFDVVEEGKGMRRIEKLGLKERLKTPEERKRLFASLTDEQYRKMLGYVNSLMRGKKISYEYGDAFTPSLVTPPREMKEPLMKEAFATVREILSDDQADPEEALRLAGLAMAGAVNYIHPYDNGNGRVGRIMHYLMEFGTERESVMEDELRALIAKVPLYEGDASPVIDDTPPFELEEALYKKAFELDPSLDQDDDREGAAAMVRTFLKMMRGEVQVPIIRDVTLVTWLRMDDTREREKIPVGGIDGKTLYVREYVTGSTAPNRSRDQMPSDEALTKILRDNRDDSEKGFITLPFDLV
ncbi:MAG TPA: Fic family protein, partial [Patescibacteria group bacterium]|nr:Fic family protein [Patescibacteria group bacterium]